MRQSLTWGLAVATANRPKELEICVRFAVLQVPAPSEIVICDASDDFGAMRERIRRLLDELQFSGRVRHFEASERSSAVQRNEVIDQSYADILFMIDDDTYMYQDCAKEVLAVYESDSNAEIGGVSPVEVGSPPRLDLPGQTSSCHLKLSSGSWIRAVVRWALSADNIFVPYDKAWPDRPIPLSVDPGSIGRIRAMHGARMTFRRSVIGNVRFAEFLKRYAAGEDSDASYRVSRTHALVNAVRAKVFHAEAGGGRLPLETVVTLGALNPCVLHRIYGVDQRWSAAAMRRLLWRRLVIGFFKDLSRRERGMPNVRGLWRAIRVSRELFRVPKERLIGWYERYQTDLIEQSCG